MMVRKQQKSGQSMVEFALLLPLLCLMLFGIIEMSIVLGIYVGLTNSAREAARAGSIYQEANIVTTSSEVTAMDNNRQLSIASTITETLNPMINTTLLTTTVSYTPTTALSTNLYRGGDIVNVHMRYTHQLFFGLLGARQINLQATSTMRIEPGGMRGGTP
jgi:Flp pilus assembly protein TadG